MESKIILRPRAEEYTAEELQKVPIINRQLVDRIQYYLFEGENNGPKYLLGLPGFGKTFGTMLALNKGIKEREDFLPGMIIYKRNSRAEPIEPYRLATTEEWGNRLQGQDYQNVDEVIRNANVVVLDDAHYICRDIIAERNASKRKTMIDNFTNLLTMLSDETENGKRIMILSEDHLTAYAANIDDSGLDKVLPKFGSFNPARIHEYGYDYAKSINPLAFHEVEPYSIWDLQKYMESLGILINDEFAGALYRIAPTPRAFVKFANLIGSEGWELKKIKEKTEDGGRILTEITFENVIESLLKRLRKIDNKESLMYRTLLRVPVLRQERDVSYWIDHDGRVSFHGITYEGAQRISNTLEEECKGKIGKLEKRKLVSKITSDIEKYYVLGKEIFSRELWMGDYILNGNTLTDAIWLGFGESLRHG